MVLFLVHTDCSLLYSSHLPYSVILLNGFCLSIYMTASVLNCNVNIINTTEERATYQTSSNKDPWKFSPRLYGDFNSAFPVSWSRHLEKKKMTNTVCMFVCIYCLM